MSFCAVKCTPKETIYIRTGEPNCYFPFVLEIALLKGSKWSFDSHNHRPLIKVWNHCSHLYLTDERFIHYFISDDISYINIKNRVNKKEDQNNVKN